MPVEPWSETVWIAHVSDDPGFTEDISALLERSEQDDFARDMVIDLSGMQHINSSNLSLLLRVRKAAIDRDARLKLAAPADPIWAVFASTGLEKVFDFAEDVPSALAGLQIG